MRLGASLGILEFCFDISFLMMGRELENEFFFGGGFVLPSKNTLTSDPFFLSGEEVVEHRHFSLSEGAHKGVLEMQYYKKRDTNPVFVGGSLTTEIPFGENEHGFQASQLYDGALTVLSKKIQKINASISGNVLLRHTTQAYWNGKKAPNSRALILSFGGGLLRNIKMGGFGVGVQRSVFLFGGLSDTESEDIDQRISGWQITLSYRRVLDFVIPWLDPLKGL